MRIIDIWMAVREKCQGPLRDPLPLGYVVRLKGDPRQLRHRVTHRELLKTQSAAGNMWVYRLDGQQQPLHLVYDFTGLHGEWEELDKGG